MDTSTVLLKLAAGVAADSIKGINLLPVDHWLASSILQKSIRRGDIITAQRAALTFWQHDKAGFWRRLHIISLEDVGVAAPDVVTATLIATNDSTWRKRVGDLRVALHLVRLLCQSLKTRLADEIYTITDRDPAQAETRQHIAALDEYDLIGLILNPDADLIERCLALWLLMGTRRYPSEHLPMREGSFDKAVAVLKCLGAPADLVAGCIGVLKRTQWPLALFTPLLYCQLKRQPRTLVSWTDCPPPATMAKGIPMSAIDQYCRIGKASYRQLQHDVLELKEFTTQQIGIGMFYQDGYCLDSRLTCLELDGYRQQGERADLMATGLTEERCKYLTSLLWHNRHRLEAIRRQHLRRYLAQQEIMQELAL